jgi:hypothetical protein
MDLPEGGAAVVAGVAVVAGTAVEAGAVVGAAVVFGGAAVVVDDGAVEQPIVKDIRTIANKTRNAFLIYDPPMLILLNYL